MITILMLIALSMQFPMGGITAVAAGSTVTTPIFSPSTGTYTSTQTVTISVSSPALAVICYTTDGTTPTATAPGTCSNGTTYTTAISISTTTTLKAIGTLATYSNSSVGSSTYTYCTPPTLTYNWVAFSASTKCNGGSACTNGAGIDTLADIAGSNNATQSTSGNRPLYETNAIGGLPAAQFNGSSMFLTLTTNIPLSTTYYGFYVVTKLAANGFIGNSAGVDRSWSIYNPSGLHQGWNVWGSSFVYSNTTLTSGSIYTLAVTYAVSTKTVTFYGCSGGTCTSTGLTGSVTTDSTTNPMVSIGDSFPGFYGNGGQIAEMGFTNSNLNVTTLGTYSSCQYGI